MGDIVELKRGPKPFAPSDFHAGNTHEPASPDHAHVAGICVDSWHHRIECYGKSVDDAEHLRDHVLTALTTVKGADAPPEPRPEAPPGSDLLKLATALAAMGIEFKRDRSDILKSDSIVFDPVDGGDKVKGHAHSYIAFRFDLEGNFKHVYIGE